MQNDHTIPHHTPNLIDRAQQSPIQGEKKEKDKWNTGEEVTANESKAKGRDRHQNTKTASGLC